MNTKRLFHALYSFRLNSLDIPLASYLPAQLQTYATAFVLFIIVFFVHARALRQKPVSNNSVCTKHRASHMVVLRERTHTHRFAAHTFICVAKCIFTVLYLLPTATFTLYIYSKTGIILLMVTQTDTHVVLTTRLHCEIFFGELQKCI